MGLCNTAVAACSSTQTASALPTWMRAREFLYEEIFVRRSYMQCGISLPKRGAPVIIDAGANIGIFSLYCLRLNPRARVIACEPSPAAFSLLERNLSVSQTGECHRVALGAASSPGVIHCFAQAPGESSRHRRERAMQRLRLAAAASDPAAPLLDLERPRAEPCDIVRLNALLRRLDVRHVHLLKVDVEGDELAVLLGLGAALEIVEQVALEVHDVYGCLWRVVCHLRRHGFRVSVRRQQSGTVDGYRMVVPASLQLWYVYAKRVPRHSVLRPRTKRGEAKAAE